MRDLFSPILIAGPTASGKSALALALAEKLGGVVINADSMQVYAELRILTARPTPDDEARAPHALYGHVPAREAYSAGRFVQDVSAVLSDARTKGLRPILVGGTGLYFKAVLEGLSPVPAVDQAVRDHWRSEGERLGSEALFTVLTQRDPIMAARLKVADMQRIVRALEVLESSGKSLSHWQASPGVRLIEGDSAVRLLLSPDRAVLQERAEARFDRMVTDGALAEAAHVASLQLDRSLPAMRAIGIAPMIAAARGEMPVADAINQAKIETRQYIKRQETWFRRNMIAWNDVSEKEMEKSLALAIAFIQS